MKETVFFALVIIRKIMFILFLEGKKIICTEKFIPTTGFNYAAKKNYALMSKRLFAKSENPLVLINRWRCYWSRDGSIIE